MICRPVRSFQEAVEMGKIDRRCPACNYTNFKYYGKIMKMFIVVGHYIAVCTRKNRLLNKSSQIRRKEILKLTV